MTDFSIVVRDGLIVDGTGNPAFRGDIALQASRIARMATCIHEPGEIEINAGGKVVAPGFIDPHAHMEFELFTNPTMEEYVFQGVTTVINGNCGHSVTPYGADLVRDYNYRNGLICRKHLELDHQWTNFREYQEAVLKNGGTTINHGTLLGHGAIRWAVMGGAHKRSPGPREMHEMKQLISQGLEQGALGLSTGLDYVPSAYATIEELIELATVVAAHDGVYASHLRNKLGIEEAVREALEIGRRSGCRVQVSHLRLGATGSYQEILEARDNGLEVAVDAIPLSAGHIVRKDRFIQFFVATPEYFDKGLDAVLADLKTEEGRQKLAELDRMTRQSPDQVYIVNTNRVDWEGCSLAELAGEAGKEPMEFLFELLLDDEVEFSLWQGRDRGNPDEPSPPDSILNPLVSPGADMIAGDRIDPFSWYEILRAGTFPTFFQFGLKKGLRLEELIRRFTSLPAQTFRLRDIGLLVEGRRADIVVFDPEKYDYPNRYERSYQDLPKTATGVSYVLVNGEPVVAAGDLVAGARPGRPLRRGES